MMGGRLIGGSFIKVNVSEWVGDGQRTRARVIGPRAGGCRTAPVGLDCPRVKRSTSVSANQEHSGPAVHGAPGEPLAAALSPAGLVYLYEAPDEAGVVPA